MRPGCIARMRMRPYLRSMVTFLMTTSFTGRSCAPVFTLPMR